MPPQNEPPTADTADNLGSLQANLESRRAKLERIRERGIDPYPPRFQRACTAAEAIARFEAAEAAGQSDGANGLSLAGRIVSMRVMGRAAFLDLRDGSGVVQAMLRQNVLGDEYALLSDLDLGDFLGVDGNMIRTRTGQATIEAHSLTMLAKGMRPLPEKWHGLRDVETRYRQRYLDLIANPEVADTFVREGGSSAASGGFLMVAGLWRWILPSWCRSRPARTLGHLLLTTTRWTSGCTCVSPPSCTSSG